MHFPREEPTLQTGARERGPKEDTVRSQKPRNGRKERAGTVRRSCNAIRGDDCVERSTRRKFTMAMASRPPSVESMAGMVEMGISGAEPSIPDAAQHHLEMCSHSVDLGCLPMIGHEHISSIVVLYAQAASLLSNGGSIDRETISKFVCLTLPEPTLILLQPDMPSFTKESASTEP